MEKPRSGILLTHKKEWSTDTCHDRGQGHAVCHLCDISRKKDLQRQKVEKGVPEVDPDGGKGVLTKGFWR